MFRALSLVSIVVAGTACSEPSAPGSTLIVSYYAQDSAFADASPLRVSVGFGDQLGSLRGAELSRYHPFLVSSAMPLDSGETLPVSVVMLGVTDDTLALARLTLGPVEPAMAYTLGVNAGGRRPASAPSRCGMQVAVPLQREKSDRTGDSLFVSISGMRGAVPC